MPNLTKDIGKPSSQYRKKHHADRTLKKSVRYDTMIKVEKRIMECLTCSLPTQKELAAACNMSVSTLKRHFKIVFGKNIYGYYQEKRMLWGLKQILNSNKNINEVARELGFMKVNNFSKAFKKQFHYLPRDLKCKRADSDN